MASGGDVSSVDLHFVVALSASCHQFEHASGARTKRFFLNPRNREKSASHRSPLFGYLCRYLLDACGKHCYRNHFFFP